MGSILSMDYVRADQAARHLEKLGDHVLGVVAFGAGARRHAVSPPVPWLDIPVLGEYDGCYEIWSSNHPVTPCGFGNINGAADGNILFGSLQLDQSPGDTLEALAERAYAGIFDFIERQGYPSLWRVWHYFPHINDPEHGLERYRSFNVGRHAAFVESGRSVSEESVPAASALGSNTGPLVIYFLAGKQPGKPIENPRQVRAYQYPESFGPRSPAFVRAMLVNLGQQQCFIISGTASVVGYETMHHGDVQKQMLETLENIRALMQQAPALSTKKMRMLFKVYLRHAADLPLVKAMLEKEFGTECRAVYLQSDICRSDLLLEIEGIYFSDDM